MEQPPKYGVVQSQPQVAYSGHDNSAVVISQVTLTVPDQQGKQPRTWSTELCGCCQDMSSCCLLFWFCPCYSCCCLSGRMGESCCAPICIHLTGNSVSLVYRTKLRAAHGIVGGAIEDSCLSLWCGVCVLCQIKRELDYIDRTTGTLAFPKPN